MDDCVRRIGVFGGTFNPIHNGHLMIARCALGQYGLDRVVFIPTGHTAYKEYMGTSMDLHRCRMVELAISDEPRFVLSLDEIDKETISFTYQTLKRIQGEYPGSRLFFLLGGDSLRDFPTWRHPEIICEEATILVSAREEISGREMESQIAEMSERFHGSFLLLDTPLLDISSSGIRRDVAEGIDIRSEVPPAVADYIDENGLYRTAV